jgi:hypothetical protein
MDCHVAALLAMMGTSGGEGEVMAPSPIGRRFNMILPASLVDNVSLSLPSAWPLSRWKRGLVIHTTSPWSG